MADHIDWAADFMSGLTHKQAMLKPDFSWTGLMILMFQELASRGFVVERRVDWESIKD